MSRNKRSEDQLAFDMAKHGWSFCNKDMLGAKLKQLSRLSEKLSNSDRRKAELRTIRQHYNDM